MVTPRVPNGPREFVLGFESFRMDETVVCTPKTYQKYEGLKTPMLPGVSRCFEHFVSGHGCEPCIKPQKVGTWTQGR